MANGNGSDDTDNALALPAPVQTASVASGSADTSGTASAEFGPVMDPVVRNPLTPPAGTAPPPPDQPAFNINDISKDTNIGFRYGQFEKPPVGMIIHHTGPGYTTGPNLGKFFANSYKGPGQTGVASQFTIDRNGNIFQLLPDGARGQHIMNGWGPGQGLSNGNVEGVEIMANGDKDVLPIQQQAAAALVAQRAAKFGYNPQQAVWGHGEVNAGHKEADEGWTVANGIRTGTLALPTVPTPSIQPGTAPTAMSMRSSTNQLGGQPGQPTGGVTPPPDVAPFLNYWADYNGIDRDIFSRMINQESTFDKSAGLKEHPNAGVGLGQLIPSTAKAMGVTDRTDVNQNLMGSAKYLRQLLDDPRVQGDYRKALQLYNKGPNNPKAFENFDYADSILQGKQYYGYKSGQQVPGTQMAVGGAVGDTIPQPSSTNPFMPQLADDSSTTANAAQNRQDFARRFALYQQMQNDQARRTAVGAMLAEALRSMKVADPRTLQSGYDPGKVAEAAMTRPPPYSSLIGKPPEETAPTPLVHKPLEGPGLFRVGQVGRSPEPALLRRDGRIEGI